MTRLIQRFTDAGQAAFAKWIGAGAPGALPSDLMSHKDYVAPIIEADFDPSRLLVSRYEFGVRLVELLGDLDRREIAYDAGLWTWLAAVYFDQICPVGPDGRRQPRKPEAYVLSKARLYFRHLVRTPWYLVSRHGEAGAYLLAARPDDSAPLSRQSYLLDQLAARQFIIASPTLIAAARILYVNPRSGQPRRGAGGKGRGSPRHLAVLVNQLALTFDVHTMPVDRFLDLLPTEFTYHIDRQADLGVPLPASPSRAGGPPNVVPFKRRPEGSSGRPT